MELNDKHLIILNRLKQEMDWIEMGTPIGSSQEIADLFSSNEGMNMCKNLYNWRYRW